MRDIVTLSCILFLNGLCCTVGTAESGKGFTMAGNDQDAGLVERAITDLFQRISVSSAQHSTRFQLPSNRIAHVACAGALFRMIPLTDSLSPSPCSKFRKVASKKKRPTQTLCASVSFFFPFFLASRDYHGCAESAAWTIIAAGGSSCIRLVGSLALHRRCNVLRG